ncbi:hypothetical protein SLS58_003088 [Diplodia intermedia]|uniref:Uncharacterized protein n=1 Tax=Diplodia intermedia TaxID=856260 RepID=A0ABR3TXN7_9PEZI
MAANGRFWPRDFLGNDLEGARVLSFGYEASLKMDSSTSQLSDFGRQLLEQLPDFRPTAESIDGKPGKLYQPVNRDQALTYARTEGDAIAIQADHREMIKFDRKTDQGYRQVLRQLKQALDDCSRKSSESYERPF